ncbi:MAG: VCBS repeat-containing protein, partial [Magnetococcales bacterium]|nr:VCBS repeat-containing protein [Magnetococcales bacterium]
TPAVSGGYFLAVRAYSSFQTGSYRLSSQSSGGIIDITAPAVPTALDLAAIDDSGVSDIDNITNRSSGLTINGSSGEAGANVVLFEDKDGNGVIDSNETLATAAVTGTVWSTDISLAAGTHSIKAVQTDIAGNKSAVSTVLAITVATTTPPEILTNLSLDTADDSGFSNSDHITNQTSGLTISGGGGVLSSRLVLFDDKDNDGIIDSGEALTTAGISGTIWSADVSLVSGTHTIRAIQTDAVGNSSSASTALMVVVKTASTDSVSFATATKHAVGSYPYSITSADFNSDGRLDIASSNYSSNNVSVLLGQASGGFAPAVNYSVDSYPYSIASADFNGDGRWDIASVSQNSNRVSVLLGLASGGFATVASYATGNSPVSVISADFNGDGRWDIATANQYSNNVSVLLGLASGGFATAANYTVGTYPSSVTSADFNGDGWVDIACTNNGSNDVSVLLGQATGDFSAAVNYSVGSYPCSITSADFNGDGRPDIASGGQYSNKISVLLGQEKGFGTPVSYDVGSSSTTIISTDFNGDGRWDIASSDQYNNKVSVLLGKATEGFATAVSYSVGDSGPASIISADFNDDGRRDIATANRYSGSVSVLLADVVPVLIPTNLDLSATDDSGKSNSDNITNQTGGLTISGKGGVAGNSLVLFDDKDGNGAIDSGEALATTAVTGTTWSADIRLTDGIHAVKAIQTDVAGNSGTASGALTIAITQSTNNVPTVIKSSKFGTEDTPVTFTATDFRSKFSDLDGDALTKVKITALPSSGTLKLSGAAVTTNQEIAASSLNNLTFVPAAGGTTSFQWQGYDGAAWSANTATVDLTITVPDNPRPTALALLATDDSGFIGDNITNKAASLTITGKGTAGAKVTLFDRDSVVKGGTAVVTAAGSWSIKATSLSKGSYSFTAQQTVDGTASSSSESLAVSVDITAPSAPTRLDLAEKDDLGLSPSDNVTRVTEGLIISGSGESGSTITLYDGKTKVVTAAIVVDDDGEWTTTLAPQSAGSHAITATQTDIAGNISKASSVLPLVVDTTAPIAPSGLDLVAADDSGTSNSDNITGYQSGLTIGGFGEKGARVILFEASPDQPLATATVGGDSKWTADISLDIGTHALSALQSDPAGNQSPTSEPLSVTIVASSLPLAPTGLALLATDDSGIVGDYITSKISGLNINGTGTPGAQITLFESGVTKAIGVAKADAVTGSWNIKGISLSSGLHPLTARQKVGNATSGDSEVLLVSIDTSTPAAPSGLQADGDLVSANTFASGAGLTVTGIGLDGATVTLFDDINKSGKIDFGEFLATAVVNNGVWTANTSLFGGSHAVKAIQTNVAGTSGSASTALAIAVRTPGDFDLDAASDTGTSKSDNITNKSSGLTLSGTAFSGGKSVTLFIDGERLDDVLTVTKGTWKVDLSLSPGSHAITAAQTDAAGDSSELSIPFMLVVDQEAPAAPTGITLSDGIELPNGGSIISKTVGLTVNGFGGDPGAKITLLEQGKTIGNAVADGDGKWSVTIAKISNGSHSVTAKQTDLAGNVGPASAALVFSIDSVVPKAPTSLKFSSSTNIISGKGEPGARLTLFNDGNGNNIINDGERIGDIIEVNTAGGWASAIITDSLPPGTYSDIKAIQTDLAGNVSKASGALGITVVAASLTRALQSYSSPLPPHPLAAYEAAFGWVSSGGDAMRDERTALLTG